MSTHDWQKSKMPSRNSSPWPLPSRTGPSKTTGYLCSRKSRSRLPCIVPLPFLTPDPVLVFSLFLHPHMRWQRLSQRPNYQNHPNAALFRCRLANMRNPGVPCLYYVLTCPLLRLCLHIPAARLISTTIRHKCSCTPTYTHIYIMQH